MKTKIIQIVASERFIYALCEDGSVWRKGFSADPESPFTRWSP